MKIFLSLACCSVMAFSLAGCSGSSGESSSSGNYVNLAKENDVISMDSRYATDGMSFEMIAATIEGLESVDADGNIIPALAESYDVSDDGLTYTFHLRDAVWSNDDPVTAQDFEYAWNATIKNPAAEYAYLFGSDGACIKNADEILGGDDSLDLAAKAVDEKTFEVELSKKCPYFLSLMSFPVFYPVNEAFAEEQGDQYALAAENMIANGPYKLVSWSKGNKLVLEKNDKYWDKAKKELGVDSITLSLLYEPSDPSKPAAEFIQSEIQKLDGITVEMVSQEKENRIEKQKARDFDMVLTRWGPDYADPTTYLNLMLTGNAYNYGDYSSKEFDTAMAEAANASTDEERWQKLQDAEAILMNDVPVVGVFQVGGASLINKKVTGIENHAVGVPYIYKNLKKES